MFTETLSSRVARLEEAHEASREEFDKRGHDAEANTLNVRKLALLKVEQALLIAGF